MISRMAPHAQTDRLDHTEQAGELEPTSPVKNRKPWSGLGGGGGLHHPRGGSWRMSPSLGLPSVVQPSWHRRGNDLFLPWPPRWLHLCRRTAIGLADARKLANGDHVPGPQGKEPCRRTPAERSADTAKSWRRALGRCRCIPNARTSRGSRQMHWCEQTFAKVGQTSSPRSPAPIQL